MPRMKFATVIPLVACMAFSAHAASYTAIKPGLWAISTAIKMQGMPAEMAPLSFISKQCITQEQLDNQTSLINVSSSKYNCKVSDTVVTDKQTSWNMTCQASGLPMQGSGTVNPISRDKFAGVVNYTMGSTDNGGIVMGGIANVEGNWQGNCTGAEAESNVPRFKPEAAPVTSVKEAPAPELPAAR